MAVGSQHGSPEYDDLQNWLDMKSREIPLFFSVKVKNEAVFDDEYFGPFVTSAEGAHTLLSGSASLPKEEENATVSRLSNVSQFRM